MRFKGVVKWYDKEKGYGFIIPSDGGKDVFLHCSNLVNKPTLERIEEGHPVEYEIFDSRKGKEGRDIIFLDEGNMLRHKKDWGPGFRIFKCSECQHKWREVCRDCVSTADLPCPECKENCYPIGYEKHYEWETDELGNLIYEVDVDQE